MTPLEQLNLARVLAEQQTPPADGAGFQQLVAAGGPLAPVTATCFLLFTPTDRTKGVRQFLDEVVPRLLPQLHRSTNPRRVELRGRARGSVDWAATVKARAAASHDPTIFVCRQSWRMYDLPENQLLLHVLDGIRQCERRTPDDLRDWSLWSPGDPVQVWEMLASTEHRLRRFMRSAYLRDVERAQLVTNEHETAALSAHVPWYRDLLDVYRRYDRVVVQPRWEDWKAVVGQTANVVSAGQAALLQSLWEPTLAASPAT